jgi:spore coat polysaccharide biosynthesis protein SpsF
MTTAATILLQARMGSTRLPGKVMERLAGRTLIEHCVRRLQSRSGLDVVIATTARSEDDCIGREGARLGVEVVRGADVDVLGRFVAAIERFGLDEVVRATADNPAVDADAPLRTLTLLRRSGADHVVEHGLPHGTAVEAVSAEALVRAAMLTSHAYDREHVTPFVRTDSRFVALSAIAPGHLRHPDLRLTVDTAKDLAYVRALFDALGSDATAAPLSDIIRCARRLGGARAGGSGMRGAR